MMMHGFGMGFGIFGLAIMLLLWIGLVFLSVWLVKVLFQRGSPQPPPDLGKSNKPADIVDQRYARGEITKEQYEIMKKDLVSYPER
jgi:putative membrane protein